MNKVKIIEAKEYTDINFDPEEYVKVTSQEYINLMQLSSYYGTGVTKLRQFEGKKLWIDGNVDLANTPTKSLGNVGYINGNLNIYKTNVSLFFCLMWPAIKQVLELFHHRLVIDVKRSL